MRLLFLAACLLSASCASQDDASSDRCCPDAGIVNRDAPVPSDPSLRTGTLPNGLRYYVRYFNTPVKRVDLRLVVNAGSVFEEADQRGLAHAIEHLAIRGSRRFPKRAVENYIESLGMRSGAGVNGTTRLDETEYRLTVPSDRAGVLDTAIAMLAGIASDAQFNPGDEGPEPGVLMEEWRLRRDAVQRIADANQSFIFAGTKYAERAPIGDSAVLRKFDLGAMQRFYTTWYRPDLMGVMVVGPFDTDAVVRAIEREFGAIARPQRETAAPPRTVPKRVDTLRAAIATDDEATGSRAAIWFLREPRHFTTLNDYRESLIRWIWMDVLQDRLNDAALAGGAGIDHPDVSIRTLARPLRAYIASATAPRGQAVPALATLAGEIRRLATDGPTEDEVDHAAYAIYRRAERNRQDGETRAGLMEELQDLFLQGNAPVTNAAAFEMSRDLLPTIYAMDVAGFAKSMSVDSAAIVFASANRNDPLVGIRPDSLLRTVASAKVAHANLDLAAATAELGEPDRPPGRIMSEGRNTATGVYTWRLSNGLRVLLKPNSSTYDEVEVRLIAPGGSSLAADSAYPSAYLSDAVIGETGVGPFPGPRLSRWLESSSVSVSPYVGEDEIQLDGSSSRDEVSKMLQLMHEYMTRPRRDTVAFRRYLDRARESNADRGRDPDDVFDDSLSALTANHSARAFKGSRKFVDAVRMDDALRFWSERFANASGMTAVIAGDFDLESLRPLVEKYLGSLPAGSPERPRDAGVRFPSGKVAKTIRAGASRSRVAIVLSGSYTPADNINQSLTAVEDLVELALGNEIRERLGGSYDVSATSYFELSPPAHYVLKVEFESDPAKIDSLTRIATSEIRRLASAGPTDAEFRTVKETRIRDYDRSLKTNDFWLDELSSHDRWKWPIGSIAEHPKKAQDMSVADLRAAAARYLGTSNVVTLTMLPMR